jgi:hypothetical protein
VGSLDEAALDKAVATEAGFHRRHDQGTKKKWTHVRIDKVDALIPKLKKVLARNVKTSLKRTGTLKRQLQVSLVSMSY